MNRPTYLRLLPLGLLLVSPGCSAAPWATWRPVSDYGAMTRAVYGEVFWWTLGIFVVVEVLLVVALWRFRHRPDYSGAPEQVHGHTALEVGWTLVPAAILFFIAIPTVRTIFTTQGPPPPDSNPLQVQVVGHQWWWEFRYPELGITTANELHVPRGRTVYLTLTSADVIHSFWVPRIGGKRDLNPGSENHIWFTPDSGGVFEGQCAEFCGTSHANMRMRVFVDEPDSFRRWAERESAVARPDSARFLAFLTSGCAACHAIDGTAAQGKVGPNLTHVGSRTTIAGATMPNDPGHLAGWLRNPDSLKPGALMPDLNLGEDRVSTLVDLLEGLR